MYDAIIVGARCAGSATALLLARKGYQVLLVDKASFPSDTISGHFIQYPGTKRLKEWGLLERVLASNCPPVTKFALDIGDFPLTAEIPVEDNIPSGVAPRRTVLDKLLLDAAIDAGAEFREQFTVTELVTQDDSVIGIRGSSRNRRVVSEHGRMVIGADGKRSTIAQMVKAPSHQDKPSLCCWYLSYWSGLPITGNEAYWQHRRMISTFPTNDGLVLIAVGWPHDEFHHFRSNIETNFLRTIELFPALYDMMPHAKREERFYGMADLPNFFRKSYGAGWALVGDARHHKDPLGGFGISDAFCDAELLADALDQGFSGRRNLETSLAEYEKTRNEQALPDYEFNCQFALLEDWNTPEFLTLRAALRTNEAQRIRYFRVLARSLSRSEFFDPENIRSIMT